DLLHLGSGRRRLNEWPWSVLGADESGDGIGGFGEFFFGCWPIGLSCTDDAVAHMAIEEAQRNGVPGCGAGAAPGAAINEGGLCTAHAINAAGMAFQYSHAPT